MSEVVKAAILKELARRDKIFNRPAYDFVGNTHAFQQKMLFSKSLRMAACAGRRSGKTATILYKMKMISDESPGCVQVYVAKTLKYAKELIWADAKAFFRDKLKEVAKDGINETSSSITLTNGSVIKLGGCNDEDAVSKFKGGHKKWYYIDEAQDIKKSILLPLLYESIIPSLIDENGGIWLTGNPNESCAGVLYEVVHHSKDFPNWEVHNFWLGDNPFLLKKSGKSAEQIIEDICFEKGVAKDDPSIQRQYYARWIKSTESIVYKLDEDKNGWDGVLPDEYHFEYIMGIDIGYDDADGIVVWAFSRDLPYLYLIAENKRSKADITALAETIKELDKKYKCIKKVIDGTGGGSKKAVEELKNRHHLHLEAAEKHQKWTYITFMNDDFNRSYIKANKELTPFTWDEWSTLLKEQDGENKPKERHQFDNHLCDAALYSWRLARHYTYRPKTLKPEVGSSKYYDDQMKNYEQDLLKKMRNNRDRFNDDY